MSLTIKLFFLLFQADFLDNYFYLRCVIADVAMNFFFNSRKFLLGSNFVIPIENSLVSIKIFSHLMLHLRVVHVHIYAL